jgi:heterodisulfide reductase subunit A-like polyferredoxin
MTDEKKATAPDGEELKIGVFVCQCGANIAAAVDTKAVADLAATLPGVAYATDQPYSCSEPGQVGMKEEIRKRGLNRVVIASCSPRLHEPTFRAMVADAGLNPYLMEMANLREQVSWVHSHDRPAATAKATDLVKMAVRRASALKSLNEMEVPVTKRSLVVGGGVAGIQAALDLADSGYEVVLVEKQPSIGGVMAQLDKTYPTMDCSI